MKYKRLIVSFEMSCCPESNPGQREGENEIVAFDVMGTEQLTMSLDDKHQIDIIE